MSKRMLIDAAHSEETRMAILENNRLEEFDFETTTKTQLKGNIYLAKVIRIEPSLQAAFVEYGGNRHGFLAFSEIHPDYYRIPIEDRAALIAEQAAHHAALDQDDEAEEQPVVESLIPTENISSDVSSDVERIGGEDIVEESEENRPAPKRQEPSRRYKIQEVIKRRQILLVQVVKEERGGKGAALTTFLSLPGRYCVLMPNAARGGGVSRKITNVSDRKRLRSIVEEFQVPEPMALIVRTAGMARTKIEIKRDCDFLLRLWDEIREKTLQSMAPALIYEEGDLIQRAIRDYYSRDVEEILVEGEEAYKHAKAYMKKLMPSHVKKVQQYKDETLPVFHKFGVELQIDRMHNPIVQLKSGGYIVFGTTEALVAIDVNSGKSTRERNLDETAYRTNLEAAEEVGRQLRLRDLAGLVVIDFIDMDDNKHIDAVERRLKESMRDDRARVQIGRISSFGLMELSRQRLRPNIIESSSLPCSHCGGTGVVRSTESSALHVLRAIEEEGTMGKYKTLHVHVPPAVAMYILNHKRRELASIEARWDIEIVVEQNPTLVPPNFRIDRFNPKVGGIVSEVIPVLKSSESLSMDLEDKELIESQESLREPSRDSQGGLRRGRFQTRTSRDRRHQGQNRQDAPVVEKSSSAEEPVSLESGDGTQGVESSLENGSVRTGRRRNRRSGRRHRSERPDRPQEEGAASSEPQEPRGTQQHRSDHQSVPEVAVPVSLPQDNKMLNDEASDHTPRIHSRPRRPRPPHRTGQHSHGVAPSAERQDMPPKAIAEKTPTVTAEKPKAVAPKVAPPKTAESPPPASPRKGWWQRLLD